MQHPRVNPIAAIESAEENADSGGMLPQAAFCDLCELSASRRLHIALPTLDKTQRHSGRRDDVPRVCVYRPRARR